MCGRPERTSRRSHIGTVGEHLVDGVTSALLIRLMLAVKRVRSSSMHAEKTGSESALLHRVNRQLSVWRGRVVTVADLAAEFGQSASRLHAVFRASAGVPLGQYIQNYRLNRAMYHLRRGDWSIADIAREAGFGSPQSFSRVFKKATGSSPRDYRKRQEFESINAPQRREVS